MTNFEAADAFDGKAGSVEIFTDKHGIDQLILQNAKGATTQATFKPPMPVRGGIPISFPQFGSGGRLEQHGFARNRTWVIDDQPPSPCSSSGSKGQASVNLLLKPSEEDLNKVWPNRFEVRLRVTLTEKGDLILRSRVRNDNGKPLSFQIAFRTYFSVSDISEVRVEGLETLDYLDCLQEKRRFTEQGDALTFESEVDRIYLNSSDIVEVFDHGSKRTFHIKKQGLPDVAVWNPWEKKAKALSDLGDDEYKQMLCVDGALIEKPISLKPGEEWVGQLELSVLSSC